MMPDLTMVVLTVDQQRCALPVSSVVRALWAVEVTPLPSAPRTVLGVINVQGLVMPVVSLRRHLGRPDRELELDDQILIVRAGSRTLALWVDEVVAVIQCASRSLVPVDRRDAGTEPVEAVLKLDDALVLVPALDRLFSSADATMLEHLLPPNALPP